MLWLTDLLLQIIVLEDKKEYMAMQSKAKQEKLQRRPFEPIIICNPHLKPVGEEGFRYWEGCLSVRGAQVNIFLVALALLTNEIVFLS